MAQQPPQITITVDVQVTDAFNIVKEHLRREPVFAAIIRERKYQNDKWGNSWAHSHEVDGYIAIMQKELDEALDAWYGNRSNEAALREILQVVAVGVACLEQHGVIEREYTPEASQ